MIDLEIYWIGARKAQVTITGIFHMSEWKNGDVIKQEWKQVEEWVSG